MPEINSSNPPPIFPIVPAPAPVMVPVPRPMPESDMSMWESGTEETPDEERQKRARLWGKEETDDSSEDDAEEPEAPKTADDGISDLFDTGADETEDIDDLFEVTDGDVIGDEDGDMSDLFEVKNEDIMGRRPKVKPKTRPFRPSGDEGMQGVGY